MSGSRQNTDSICSMRSSPKVRKCQPHLKRSRTLVRTYSVSQALVAT